MRERNTYVVSSFRKYEILSPQRLHPTAESFASIVEYINGRIPSLYKLPDFTKLTIDSLHRPNENETKKHKREGFYSIRMPTEPIWSFLGIDDQTIRLQYWMYNCNVLAHNILTYRAHSFVYSSHENKTIACAYWYINPVVNIVHNKLVLF